MKHKIRGALITVLASLALGFLMFYPRVLGFGVGLGVGLLAVVLVGLLDFFGTLQIERGGMGSPSDKPSSSFDPDNATRWMLFLSGFNIRVLWIGLALLVAGACRVSVIGTMGAAAPWSGPLLFGLGLAAILVARVKRPRPFDGNLHQGFLVFAVATASIMATLGSQGLWDCWETHYGEVARRQLEQDDWISLFWESKWFYSKPILIFWMMNLGMALFGVRVTPDEISPHAEWGIRFFVAALAIMVIWAVYQLLARRISKRAGLFAAVVIGTMPLYAFMARQAITDLPFVGLMTLAVVLFLLGITVKPDAEVRPFALPLGKGRRLPLSGFHAVVAGYVLVAVPQFIYLATRSTAFTHGNLGRGNVRAVNSHLSILKTNLSDVIPSIFGTRLGAQTDISLDWLLLGMAYTVPFLILLFTLRKERRISRLCFHGMYLCLALSVMAKGMPGLLMPILGLFGLWIFATPWKIIPKKRGFRLFIGWHWDKVKRLDMGRGIALFLLVASPWYVAMFFRHGMSFINRFFIHDHIKRLSVGVHGDNGTFQYFIQQLGYAVFPWVAFLPFALVAWYRWRSDQKSNSETSTFDNNRMIRSFCASWGILSFGLLAMMVTKFHHYVFPLIPPVAILIGLFLDDIWEGRVKRLGPVSLIGVAILALVAQDLIAPAGKGVLHGYTQIVGLFIYKYSRPYPDGPQYDISMPILVFTAGFSLLMAGMASARLRRGAVVATLLLALMMGHWLTQHHMVELAPHWTQKHLVEEYYAKRKSPAERLVAFQMNWKGENFYTGNRVIVHVSTKNKNFEKWIDKHRGERHFFITEYKRFKRMSSRAKAASGPLKPFADTCNKYKAGWADEL